MEKYLLVAAGGAAGSVARYSLGVQATRWLGPGWPYGTFAANILGGLMMGLLVGFLAHRGGRVRSGYASCWRSACWAASPHSPPIRWRRP